MSRVTSPKSINRPIAERGERFRQAENRMKMLDAERTIDRGTHCHIKDDIASQRRATCAPNANFPGPIFSSSTAVTEGKVNNCDLTDPNRRSHHYYTPVPRHSSCSLVPPTPENSVRVRGGHEHGDRLTTAVAAPLRHDGMISALCLAAATVVATAVVAPKRTLAPASASLLANPASWLTSR